MAMRRAFIMGSNGPADLSPLDFARLDAESFANVLGGPRCGFQVTMPEAGASAFAVRRMLYEAVEACEVDDTFLCYFSGHGFLERGSLFLLWDDSDVNRLLSSTVPVADLLQAIKICPAENKLLILDCCHAGAVVNMVGLKNSAEVPVSETEIRPENHLVLMASNRLERARELHWLRASFMTKSITTALGEGFADAGLDGDNRMSIGDLRRWLESEARQHNRNYPDYPVPVPFLFGQSKGEYYLTVGRSDWQPYELPWADGSTMVVLPRHPRGGVLCLSKHPITNAQYRRFVDATDDGAIVEPEGRHFVRGTAGGPGRWEGPFYPWRDDAFNHSDMPVVCISYDDALAYCEWVSKDLMKGRGGATVLPTAQVWDLAAFGTEFPTRNPSSWLSRTRAIHHKAPWPAPVDRTGERTNTWGIADMIGNVWEWCRGTIRFIGKEKDYESTDGYHAAMKEKLKYKPEIRGGGFMDDLSRTQVFLEASLLPQRTNTRHSDLGFRIAAELTSAEVPEHLLELLNMCKEYEPVYLEEPVAQ